jgi:hypothetical protein
MTKSNEQLNPRIIILVDQNAVSDPKVVEQLESIKADEDQIVEIYPIQSTAHANDAWIKNKQSIFSDQSFTHVITTKHYHEMATNLKVEPEQIIILSSDEKTKIAKVARFNVADPKNVILYDAINSAVQRSIMKSSSEMVATKERDNLNGKFGVQGNLRNRYIGN